MTKAERWLDNQWWMLLGMRKYALRLRLVRWGDWYKFIWAQEEIERLERCRASRDNGRKVW